MDRMHQFAQSLEVSIQLTRQLEAVMMEETRAIQTRDPDFLHRIVSDKQKLVVQLEEETSRQKGWVELENHPFTPAGMTKFLATLDNRDQMLGHWSILRETLSRCDRINQDNARLIERDRRRVATSLRILNGDDGISATYNPRGRTESGPRSRSISQA